jgi:hypothetical protein
MLLLGDNAYETGTDDEFQSRFFNIYSSNILKNHQLFPSPGNHDYANNATRQNDHNIPYYSIFTNPSAAECGGIASGTKPIIHGTGVISIFFPLILTEKKMPEHQAIRYHRCTGGLGKK